MRKEDEDLIYKYIIGIDSKMADGKDYVKEKVGEAVLAKEQGVRETIIAERVKKLGFNKDSLFEYRKGSDYSYNWRNLFCIGKFSSKELRYFIADYSDNYSSVDNYSFADYISENLGINRPVEKEVVVEHGYASKWRKMHPEIVKKINGESDVDIGRLENNFFKQSNMKDDFNEPEMEKEIPFWLCSVLSIIIFIILFLVIKYIGIIVKVLGGIFAVYVVIKIVLTFIQKK